MRRRPAVDAPRLRVDPVACDGGGMCGFLAPDVVALDRWGFPKVSEEPLLGSRLRQAGVAVGACPRRALFLEAARTDGCV